MDLSQLANSLVQGERAQAAPPPYFGYINPGSFSIPGRFRPQYRGIQATSLFNDVYPMVQNEGRTSALLATTLWQVMLASNRFGVRLAMMGLGLPRPDEGRVMIVMHEHEGLTRYDLLLLLPERSDSRQPSSIPLASLLALMKLSDREIEEFVIDWGNSLAKRLEQLHVFGELSREEYEEALALFRTLAGLGGEKLLGELIRAQPFSLMTARMPQMVRTGGVPSSAAGITLQAGGEMSCTAGIITRDEHGRAGVTTCLHGVVPDPDSLEDQFNEQGAACVVGKSVYVGGVSGVIRSVNLITDSCFIEVDLPPTFGVVAVNGPMRGKSPYQKEPVNFHGIVSKKKGTFITGLDPSIPLVARGEQAKVYTQAVTNPGDSGAALVNADGFVLGFSYRRTGMGEPIEFAEWIWADSVYGALKLERT